jgi:hypothetical protein
VLKFDGSESKVPIASTPNSKKSGELLSYFFSLLFRNRHTPARFYDPKEGILWLQTSQFYFLGTLQDVNKIFSEISSEKNGAKNLNR